MDTMKSRIPLTICLREKVLTPFLVIFLSPFTPLCLASPHSAKKQHVVVLFPLRVALQGHHVLQNSTCYPTGGENKSGKNDRCCKDWGA